MRLLAALLVLAASTSFIGGAYSTFTASVSNSSNLGTNPTFNPTLLTAPVATGTVAANQTLSVQTQGTWRSNVSIARTYQWQVCTSLVTSTCADILTATASTYPLGVVPVGTFFRVVETATNAFGATASASGILQ